VHGRGVTVLKQKCHVGVGGGDECRKMGRIML